MNMRNQIQSYYNTMISRDVVFVKSPFVNCLTIALCFLILSGAFSYVNTHLSINAEELCPSNLKNYIHRASLLFDKIAYLFGKVLILFQISH